MEVGMLFITYWCVYVGLVFREDAEWMIEIEGFLGIMDILGVQHLMVILGKEEVACLPHKHSLTSEDGDVPASIYELQEIELIPFQEQSLHGLSPNKQPPHTAGAASATHQQHSLEYQMNALREGIKRFLEFGFYVASFGFDLTSNCQRRDRLLTPTMGPEADPLRSLDSRYMWNYNLYKQLRL